MEGRKEDKEYFGILSFNFKIALSIYTYAYICVFGCLCFGEPNIIYIVRISSF